MAKPLNSLNFSSLTLKPELQSNLESLNYSEMTEIQAQSLPQILDGKDLIAQAKTGSGKTAAFGLGVLQKLAVKRFRVQSLVLCPTRELADQVASSIRQLARTIHNIKVLTLCGGMPFGPQIGSLEHGAHIVVGTPGRLEEHVRKGNLDLSNIEIVVLDEADRMLEMGFQTELDAIIAATPSNRQTLLFSATYPDEIAAIAKRVMRNPAIVKVESTHEENTIEQQFFKLEYAQRAQALRLLLLQHQPESAVVFCNTKKETSEVVEDLLDNGFSALALNGDLEQRDRDQTLARFANKSVSVLVATDVAARGLDISELDLVVNYELSRDAEVHTHRVGRTGRAGAKGLACSFYSDKDHFKVLMIEEVIGRSIEASKLPSTKLLNELPPAPIMSTIQIDGGKKQKVRPGDIVGALTGDNGINGDEIGKIKVTPHCAYVAVKTEVLRRAISKLGSGKIKGRNFRVRPLS